MSRDVLIVLLVVGLAANVALLALVAYVNHRAATGRRPGAAGDPGAPVAADDTDPARLLALGAGLVDPDWIDTRRVDEAHPGTAAGPEPALAGQPAIARPITGSRRSRRFVMPDRDEDHARSERAIASVLGDAARPDPETRSARRRHRARRPAGTPAPRTDFVVSLAGQAPDVRIVHALCAALRHAVRPSDKVVELPGGRLRIILETDAAGGEAFVRRARSAVHPWLTALDPELELRVERPRNPPRQGARSS